MAVSAGMEHAVHSKEPGAGGINGNVGRKPYAISLKPRSSITPPHPQIQWPAKLRDCHRTEPLEAILGVNIVQGDV